MAVDDHFLSHVEKMKASSERAEEQEKKMVLDPPCSLESYPTLPNHPSLPPPQPNFLFSAKPA